MKRSDILQAFIKLLQTKGCWFKNLLAVSVFLKNVFKCSVQN